MIVSEIVEYRERLLMQLEGLESIDVDPYNDENAVEYQKMLSYHEGQLKAVNRILNISSDKPINHSVFTMYGGSDDLIELEGDISDELGAYDVVRKFFLSDGTSGTIEYTKSGVWEIKILKYGCDNIKVDIVHPTEKEIEDDTNYTDKATFSGKIEWIIFDEGTILKPD
jgi:hypothetical protein